jgi:hypothetical protein
VIVPLTEAALVGRRLERLVLDRRFDQLVVFLGPDGAAGAELVYHRTDTARLDLELLELAASRRSEVSASAVRHDGDWVVHRIELDGTAAFEVWCREANVVVGAR